jgi:hypothetical protein
MKRGVLHVNETYHSDFYRWLSTKHSTSSHKSNTTTSKIVYRTVLPCNISPSSNKTLHVVHNTSHAFEVKQDTLLSLLVLYAPGHALLQRQVKLLTTWGLWTSENLMFHLLLLRKYSHGHESYMRW